MEEYLLVTGRWGKIRMPRSTDLSAQELLAHTPGFKWFAEVHGKLMIDRATA